MAARDFVVSLILLSTFTSVLANPAPAPAITEGPQAYVSWASLASFSTLKPCAQGCLKYNGPYVCYMAGFDDIGKAIQCGCSPQNYCVCDAREASRATSYIQSCVQTKCGIPGEVSAVLDLYNGYCATANTAISTTSTKPYTFTGSTSKTLAGSEPTSNDNFPTQTGRSTASVAGSQQTSQRSGNTSGRGNSTGPLSIGAIVGIAVGGVFLITALLCAGCCLLWRRRRTKKKAAAAATATALHSQGFTAGQGIHYIPPTGEAVQIDGAGVYGKANGAAVVVEEKPHKVSPLNTPAVPNSQVAPQGHQYEQVSVPVAYEKYGTSIQPHPHGYGHPGGQVYEKSADNVYEKP